MGTTTFHNGQDSSASTSQQVQKTLPGYCHLQGKNPGWQCSPCLWLTKHPGLSQILRERAHPFLSEIHEHHVQYHSCLSCADVLSWETNSLRRQNATRKNIRMLARRMPHVAFDFLESIIGAILDALERFLHHFPSDSDKPACLAFFVSREIVIVVTASRASETVTITFAAICILPVMFI